MLTDLDDTLLHQAPLPFAFVGASDHRFYDRYWFEAFAPDGSAGVLVSMGRYANMNVLDGFVAAQTGGRQYNVRFSRELRPAFAETKVGGLSVSLVEPLKVLRLRLEEGDHPLACDLTWTGSLPARLEGHSFSRAQGRVVSDMYRFAQVGTVSGALSIDGRAFEAAGWFGARDHSWGVRPGVGGFEPVTGGAASAGAGRLFIWLAFRVGELGGYVQLHEDHLGRRQSLDGALVWPGDAGRPELAIVDMEHDLTFHEGTRAFSHARLVLTTEDEQRWEIEAEPVFTAWAYKGTGYGNGYDDEKGLGAYRGEYLEETDIYDVSHPEIVRNLDGAQIPSGHREQPVRLTVNGKPGFGHLPIMVMGPNQRYGLQAT